METLEQKEPLSKEDIGTGIADSYFSANNNESDDALVAIMDTYDSSTQLNRSTHSELQKSTLSNSSMQTDLSNNIDSSDEELLVPVFDAVVPKVKREKSANEGNEKTVNLSSAKTSTRETFSSKVKTEKFENESNAALFDEKTATTSSAKASMQDGFVPKVKTEKKVDEKNTASFNERTVNSSSTKASLQNSFACKVKVEKIVDESNTASLKESPVNTLSAKTSTHESFAPRVKTGKSAAESNAASFCVRTVNSSSVEASSHSSFVPEMKTETFETHLDTVLYPELLNDEAKVEVDSIAISGNWNDSNSIQQNEQRVSEALQRDDGKTLSSISKQLENDAFVDNGIMNFWDDYCGYSELIFNSQNNAIASIEDDLEDLCSAQTDSVEEENSTVSNREDKGSVDDEFVCCNDGNNLALPGEDGETLPVTAVKRVTFRGDTSAADAAVSSGRPFVSPAPKPVITTPKKALTEDEFFHEILHWNVINLGNPERNEKAASLPRKFAAVPVPEKTGFDSMDQYYDTFKPLLFMETWEQVWRFEWRVLFDFELRLYIVANRLMCCWCSPIMTEEQYNSDGWNCTVK